MHGRGGRDEAATGAEGGGVGEVAATSSERRCGGAHAQTTSIQRDNSVIDSEGAAGGNSTSHGMDASRRHSGRHGGAGGGSDGGRDEASSSGKHDTTVRLGAARR